MSLSFSSLCLLYLVLIKTILSGKHANDTQYYICVIQALMQEKKSFNGNKTIKTKKIKAMQLISLNI